MPYVFAFMRAVRESDLPAVTRHVLLTLASLADPDTGVIPDRFTPSLSDLRKATGLARSTVAEHLARAETDGWVRRVRPDVQAAWRDGERTRYALVAPSPGDGLVRETDHSDQDTPDTTSPPAGLPSPGDGLGVVRQPDQSASRTSPPAGHVVPTMKNSSTKSSSETPRPKRRSAEPDRADVAKICQHLVDRLVANGCKRPTITDRWRREARLLLDEPRDPPINVDKVIALIDWCQRDPFWAPNIQSMPKLREKFDTLRMRALDEYERGRNVQGRRNGGLVNGATTPRRSPGAERFEKGMALAAQLDAELAARQAAAGGTR